MADKAGAAIDSATEPILKGGATTPMCVACGHYHGSINAELICLRSAVAEQRRTIAWLRGA